MFQITINQIPFSVELGSITGSEIRKVGNTPFDQIIKFQIPGHTNLIEIGDNDHVDLTRPGAEHFFSDKVVSPLPKKNN